MSNKIWTELEIEFVRKNSPFISDKEGAKQFLKVFGRKIDESSWRYMRNRLGLRKTNGVNSKIKEKKIDRKVEATASTTK